MAYFFNGTSQHLTTTSAPVSVVPLTMACWFNSSAASVAIMSIGGSSGTATQRFQLSLASQRVQAGTVGTTSYGVSTTTTYTLNTWAHCCAVYANNPARIAYLNAGGAVSGTNITTPTGLTSLSIGSRYQSGFGAFFPGSLAEVGVWSAALQVEEIASLARGVSPLFVRPQSLVFYAPLLRELVDLRGGLEITNNSDATVTVHPRIYL